MLVLTKWFDFLQAYDKSNDTTRVAPLLNVLTLVVIAITALALVALAIARVPNLLSYVAAIVNLMWGIVTRIILARGHARLAAIVLLSAIYVTLSLLAIFTGGLTSASFGTLALISLFAGLMLGPRSALLYMGIFILTVAGFYMAEVNHWLPRSIEQRPVDYVIAYVSSAMVGMVFIIYVIHFINQSMAEIQRSEEQFREIFELAPFGMATVALDGQFLRANQALCNILGYTSRELRYLKFPAITHPDDVSKNLRLTEQLINGEISNYELEKRYLRKDDSTVSTFLRASLIRDAKGDPHQLLAQVVDLTERRQSEKALRQAQKLESLGVLAGGIAHDFNNLLTAMLGQSSLAKTKLPADSPARANVEKIVSAAERAASLTHQMLAYAGQGQPQILPLDLNDVIRDNLHLLDVAIPKSVHLERKLADPLPLINADMGQLQQMIMNLIINAAEAVALRQEQIAEWSEESAGHRTHGPKQPEKSAQGQVTVVTDTVTIGEGETCFLSYSDDILDPGIYVSLCITDTGVGMDEETLTKIFDPFFSTKMSGRGLGLAAVLGIVRGHGGGLRVKRKLGEGTSFYILLPATTMPLQAAPPAPSNQHANGLVGCGILVIDDEVAVRDAVIDILSLHGAQMLAAADGATGIEIYHQSMTSIHLIILDLSMPGLSGEETFHRLRTLNPKVPILLSSGYSESASSIRLMQDNISSFLHKPYQWNELLAAVEKHVGYVEPAAVIAVIAAQVA